MSDLITSETEFDTNLNRLDSLLRGLGITANVNAGSIESGVFGSTNTTNGIEFGVNPTTKDSYIQSRNFVSGSAGWQIDNDGNVEFNSGTFRGTLSAASGTLGAITVGTNAWHIDSSGNMWWGSAATYALATASISATMLIKGAIFTATTGNRIDLSETTNAITMYSTNNYKSTIVWGDAELRLRMEQAGGYTTLYAQNDVNSAIEVLRADGDAGVSITSPLAFTANKTTLTIASGAVLALTINNAGSGSSLDINQTSATNADYLATLTHAGTGNGLYVELTKTTNTNSSLYVSHSGTGYAGLFTTVDNASRTLATVYVDANSGRGSHLHLEPIATAPSTPTTGDIYMDTDGVVYVYSLTGWAALNVAV